MSRTYQFYLPDELADAFEAAARAGCINKAEVVRRLIAQWVKEQTAAGVVA